jgi:hypothetical protein
MVEDALGLKFTVPSEYDHSLLRTIIEHRFRKGPGWIEVEVGNYELVNAKNSCQVIISKNQMKPGSSIKMAIVIAIKQNESEQCPISNCRSRNVFAAPEGGFLW